MKEKQPKPVHMPWGRERCTIIKEWQEPVNSGTAKGTGYFVTWTCSKGKEHSTMKWIKWENM